jgi:murein L,D-transpeptidase YafK
MSFSASSFKDEQKKFSRVRQAYKDKESVVLGMLAQNSIDKDKLRIYLRAFKQEKEIELWAKNSSGQTYQLIKRYDVCRTSGSLGPKRKQGDLQIPEGFYHINRFNPYSNFYLSLGLNYPNRSDKILGVKGDLGGDIFIHGSCVTIGCLPITDDEIKELYLFCIEARNSGQDRIPVTVFPAELTDSKFSELKKKYRSDSDKVGLWSDLKKGFDIFNETKRLPFISFLSTGRHTVKNHKPT